MERICGLHLPPIEVSGIVASFGCCRIQTAGSTLRQYLAIKMKLQKAPELNITHQDVTTEMGTSRELISRLLKRLEKRRGLNLDVTYLRGDFEELINT